MLLTLSQISGTCDCLKVLAGQGVLVPEAVLEKLAADKAQWEANLNALEVTDLEPDDFNMTPPPSHFPRDVPAELPSGVDQFGTNSQAISPADAVDLRNEPNI